MNSYMETTSAKQQRLVVQEDSRIQSSRGSIRFQATFVDRVYSCIRQNSFSDGEFLLREVLNFMHTDVYRHHVQCLRLFFLVCDARFEDAVRLCEESGSFSTENTADIFLRAGRYDMALNYVIATGTEGELFCHKIAALGLSGRPAEAQAWIDHWRDESPEVEMLNTVLCFESGDIKGALERATTYNKALCLFHLDQRDQLELFLLNERLPIEEAQAVNVLKSVVGLSAEELRGFGPDPILDFNNQLRNLTDGDLVRYLETFVDAGPVIPLRERNLRYYALANLLIVLVESEAYSKAADILTSVNEQLIARCFLEEGQFEYIKLLTRVKSEILKHETISHLKRSIDMQLVALSQTRATKIREDQKKNLFRACCLLGQAYWDSNDFDECEELFRSCKEYCSEYFEWKINFANLLLIREKFKDAIVFYEQLVVGSQESHINVLSLPAAAIANFCVCLIMCDRNREAEEMLEKVLDAEEALHATSSVSFHSTVINLVIGHLYCSKKNFEFGMDRVFAALCDNSKIHAESWYYFKTTFMSMLTFLVSSDSQELISDSFIEQTESFLDRVCNSDLRLISNTGDSIINEAIYMRDLFKRAVYCSPQSEFFYGITFSQAL